MSFEAVLGMTCGCLAALGEEEDPDAVLGGCLAVPCASETTLVTPSGLAVAVGGGKGEIDMLVMDAECALYARKDWNEGRDITCYTNQLTAYVLRWQDIRHCLYEYQ